MVGRPSIDIREAIVDTILGTIVEGWRAVTSLHPPEHDRPREVWITEQLRDGMRAVVKNRGIVSLIVLPGTESRSTPEKLVPDGRTDIPVLHLDVYLRSLDPDPHAIIECKLIDGDSRDLCREYVQEGIDRFATGKYGGNHAHGFMAGYVIAGDEASAADGVNGVLESKDRPMERLEATATAWRWTSHHPRSGRPMIRLHHAFLVAAQRPA